MTSKELSNRAKKTVTWGKTFRKYSWTKRTLANFKTTGAAEQKEFSIEYMFRKQKWFIIRLIVNNLKILLFNSGKHCVETTKTSK